MVIESVEIQCSPERECLLNWKINGEDIDSYYNNLVICHKERYSNYTFINSTKQIIKFPFLDIYLRIMLADDFIRNRP